VKNHRPEEWRNVLRAIRLVRDETDVEVDASLGLLTKEEAEILVKEGINHYSHNIAHHRGFSQKLLIRHHLKIA